APLLGHRGLALGLPDRQLARLEPGEEDGVELEALGAVEREEVDAARRPGPEEPFQLRLQLRDVVEPLRHRDDAREIGLPRLLSLAEALRWIRNPAELLRHAPHDLVRRARGAPQPLQQPARALA